MAFIDFEGYQNQVSAGSPAPLQLTNTRKAGAIARLFPLWVYFDRLRVIIGRGLARYISRWYKLREAFIRNWDPRTAEELLPDWEGLFELEPAPTATLEDRRQAALAKLRSVGGSTKAYYEQVAIDFGYLDVVVTDVGLPATCTGTCVAQLLGGEWLLVFKLTAASQGLVRDNQLEILINGQPLLAGWYAIFEFT